MMGPNFKHPLIAILLIALGADPTTLGEKVLEFARSKVGQKVGDGECGVLATEALRQAGARRPGRAGASWGDELTSIAEVRPGDILVLEDTVFVSRRMREDGAIVTLTYRSPHHVAIVSGVKMRGKGASFAVLQQNVGFEGATEAEKKVVREGVVNMAELRGGKVRAYRPVAAEPSPR